MEWVEALVREGPAAGAAKCEAQPALPGLREGKRYACEACGAAFPLRALLDAHLDRRLYVLRAQCGDCEAELDFPNRCRALHHERRHGPRRCLRSFRLSDLGPDEPWGLDLRPLMDLKAVLAAETQAFSCAHCAQTFPSAEQRRRHFVYNLPSNQKQYICSERPDCSAVFFSPCGHAAHLASHRRPGAADATCAECGEGPLAALAAHLAAHRFRPLVLNAWRCSHCSSFYANLPTLLLHTASAHSRPRPDPGLPAPPGLHCPKCRLGQPSKEALLHHLQSHVKDFTPFRVFRCPLCGRLMENKTGLLGHYARSHGLTLSPEQVHEVPFQLDPASGPPSPSQAPASSPRLAAVPSASSPAPKHSRKRAAPLHLPSAEEAEAGGEAAAFPCPICPPSVLKPLPNDFLLRLHMRKKHPDKEQPPLSS